MLRRCGSAAAGPCPTAAALRRGSARRSAPSAVRVLRRMHDVAAKSLLPHRHEQMPAVAALADADRLMLLPSPITEISARRLSGAHISLAGVDPTPCSPRAHAPCV